MAPPSKNKTLFDDDHDEEKDETSLKIDKKFAAAFQSRKQKEELRQLALDDDGDSDASTSSEEDEDAQLLTEELDVNIFKTINALRNKDKKIYDSNIRFFDSGPAEDTDSGDDDSDDKAKKQSKPKRYKDVIREQVLDQMEREEASEADGAGDKGGSSRPSRLAYDMEQQEIRKAFIQATKDGDEDSGSESDDNKDTLLSVKRRHKPSDDGLSKELEQELEKLRATSDSKDLVDPRGEVKDGEAFLLDYFKKKTWKKGDTESDDESDGDASDQDVPMKRAKGADDDDEDSLEDLDKADDFEAQYNFRFEQAASASASGAEQSLVSYARDMSGTLRRKDESRKEKRLARQERKAAERKAKEEELKRLKNLKRQEVNEKLKQVKTVLGEVEGRGAAVDEAAILKLIEGDFDPDKYEKLMEEAYGDDFYEKEDSEWKSELDIRNTLKSDEDGDLLVGHDDEHGGLYDDEAYDEEGEYGEEKYGDEEGYDEEEEEEAWAEAEALEEAESETPLERQVREKLTDELYKLDYEDIVAGQPTRFKYRKVEANSYGLSTEEILFARDTTLRQFVSLKQMAPYNEREFHVNGKKRRRFREMLKQELETPEEEVEDKETGDDGAQEADKPKKKSRRSKKGKAKVAADESLESSELVTKSTADDEASGTEASEAAPSKSDKKSKDKKKKHKKKNKNKDGAVAGLSNSRLAAYGL